VAAFNANRCLETLLPLLYGCC